LFPSVFVEIGVVSKLERSQVGSSHKRENNVEYATIISPSWNIFGKNLPLPIVVSSLSRFNLSIQLIFNRLVGATPHGHHGCLILLKLHDISNCN
jgi:hypothetical protein